MTLALATHLSSIYDTILSLKNFQKILFASRDLSLLLYCAGLVTALVQSNVYLALKQDKDVVF